MIRCENVSKEFRSGKALKHIDLHIKRDTIVGLVGRNGAGKTTLLKLITGCWKATEGKIEVFDTNPFNSLYISTNTILVDDEMVFPESLTIGEILEVSKQFYPNWDNQLAKRLFSYFELNETVYYYQLSKGKKSTFNAIVGLATHAPLTVFDEPTTGMDRSVRQDFYRALLKDYMNFPRTIIISSHHIEEIEHILEQLILIDLGKLLLHKSIDDVRDYAISIRGDEVQLRSWLKDKVTLYEEAVGINELYAVIKNEAGLIGEAKRNGYTVSNVMAADLAVYLTKREKGGIDDVFSKTN